MAMIRCPECNCKVSSTAIACPNCGFNVAVNYKPPTKEEMMKDIKLNFFVIIPIGIIVLLALAKLFEHFGIT